MRVPGGIAMIALLILCSLLSGAAAQEQNGARLTLSPGSGLPDSEISIPAYLWNSGTPLGSISLALNFPAPALTFVRAELTVVGETAGAVLAVDSATAAGTDTSTINLSVTVPATGPSRESLPDGPLVYITFRIAKDAPLGSEFILKPTATGLTADDTPEASGPIETGEVRITVQSPPVSGCFFYMH